MNSCCFPNEVLYPRPKEPQYYPIGSYFNVATYRGLSRLVYVEYNKIALISPGGGYHNGCIIIPDMKYITAKHISELTIFDWTYVPDVEPPHIKMSRKEVCTKS